MALHQRIVRPSQLLWRNVNAAFTASYYSSKAADIDTDIGGKSKTKDYIGIDVGSSNVYVSTIDQHTNKPKLITKMPFQSGLHKFEEPLNLNPADIVYGCKFLLNRKFSDPLIQREMERVTYKIIQGPNGEAWIQTSFGRLALPTLIHSKYLLYARETADAYLGKSVSRAVITYPGFFSADQLREMLKVGLSTGLDLIHTIDEATAVAFAYGMNNKEEGPFFVVIDVGGRTLDVSVLQVSARGRFKFKAPTKSDFFAAGAEFDNVVANYLLSEADLSDTKKTIVRNDKLMFQKFRFLAERVKVELSSAFRTRIIWDGPGGESSSGPIDLTLTRFKFESLLNLLIDKMKNHVHSCLKEADITTKDVDEVLLVGGMSTVPKVEIAVCEIFGKSPSRGVTNPEEAVALGAAAAVQAGHFGENPWND